MAIKNIIAKGIGFSPATNKWLPTHGFGIGVAETATNANFLADFQAARRHPGAGRVIPGPHRPIRGRSIYRPAVTAAAPFERRVWQDRSHPVYWRVDYTVKPRVLTLASEYSYIPVDGWTIPGGQIYITSGIITLNTGTALTGTFSVPQEAPFLLRITNGILVHTLT